MFNPNDPYWVFPTTSDAALPFPTLDEDKPVTCWSQVSLIMKKKNRIALYAFQVAYP